MKLMHTRQQFAVGQGFFHAGSIRSNSDRFRYVYDCGSFTDTVLRSRVDSFLKAVNSQKIHHLYISHLDYDHVSGIKYLVDESKSGPKIETVFLPYFNPIARLAALGSVKSKDPRYCEFLANPVRWLNAKQNVEEVVIVYGDQMGPEGEPGPPSPERNFNLDLNENNVTYETVAFRSRFETKNEAPDYLREFVDDWKGTRATFMHHSAPVIVEFGAGGLPGWLLVPYVDPLWPGVCSLRDVIVEAFGEDLLQAMNRGDNEVAIRFQDDGFRRKLKKVYEKAGRVKVNATSMSLYSGPAFDCRNSVSRFISNGRSTPCCALCDRQFQSPDFRWLQMQKAGWLGTGDAELSPSARGNYDRFRRFYGVQTQSNLLEGVCTLTLPHHGSSHNFNPRLLEDSSPANVIVSAGKRSRWGHPHGDVLEFLIEEGFWFEVIHEDSSTGFIEHFTWH